MFQDRKQEAPSDLEISSLGALSRAQVESLIKANSAATESSSVNWEFTQIQECCCTFTCSSPDCGSGTTE